RTTLLSARPDNDRAGRHDRGGQRHETDVPGFGRTRPGHPSCCNRVTHAEDRTASGGAWHGDRQPAPRRRATVDRTEAGKSRGPPPAFVRYRRPGQVVARPRLQRGQGHGVTAFGCSQRRATRGYASYAKPE